MINGSLLLTMLQNHSFNSFCSYTYEHRSFSQLVGCCLDPHLLFMSSLLEQQGRTKSFNQSVRNCSELMLSSDYKGACYCRETSAYVHDCLLFNCRLGASCLLSDVGRISEWPSVICKHKPSEGTALRARECSY